MQDTVKEPLFDGHREMLVDGLKRVFGEFDQEMLERIMPRFEWVELSGGDVLFSQGDRDDSLYFVISGRLRAARVDTDGTRTVLGDIARGETVGEMAFFTQRDRSATVTAIRDSVLARFGSQVFRDILMAYPMVSLNLTRLVIERMQRSSNQKGQTRPVTLGLVAATPGVDLEDCVRKLARELGTQRRSVVLDARRVDEWLGRPGAAQVTPEDAQGSRALMRKLEQVESENDFVLFLADAQPTPWTHRCLRHCDHVMVFADARAQAAVHPVEAACLAAGQSDTQAVRTLVLMHPPGTRVPSGTARWLEQRPGMRFFHLRTDLPRDWPRLARVVGGGAVGLVLSGGGARGFAHLGVMKALQQAGIEYDLIGGTSIGSAMAAYAALDLPADEAIERARETFRRNPTGDYNMVPMVSLIGGRRLREAIDSGIAALMGEGGRIEDMWKTYFCISSNYTAARETVLMAGPVAKSIRASVSIPGALPPVVIDGELHIDGGTFNNFPTDVMARIGADRIIGVNLLREGSRRYTMEELPGAWRLVFDKMRGKQHRLPGLVPLMLNATIMTSLARQAEAKRLVDLYFAPEARGCGMLDWAKFDRIVQAGYEHACKHLQTAPLDGFARRETAERTASGS